MDGEGLIRALESHKHSKLELRDSPALIWENNAYDQAIQEVRRHYASRSTEGDVKRVADAIREHLPSSPRSDPTDPTGIKWAMAIATECAKAAIAAMGHIPALAGKVDDETLINIMLGDDFEATRIYELGAFEIMDTALENLRNAGYFRRQSCQNPTESRVKGLVEALEVGRVFALRYAHLQGSAQVLTILTEAKAKCLAQWSGKTG